MWAERKKKNPNWHRQKQELCQINWGSQYQQTETANGMKEEEMKRDENCNPVKA